MRDPVQAILDFNSNFDQASLQLKLAAITASPFAFFRATFHLFASDILSGAFSKLPVAPSKGQIVADLHTENFGSFRAVSGDIVYDVNDFDDTAADQPYEFDLRRLLTSIILGGTENGLRIGDAVNAIETAARAYFAAIGQFAAAQKRENLATLHDSAAVKRLLKIAAETPREAFMRTLAEPAAKGHFQFKAGNPHFRPVDARARAEVQKEVPDFLAHCALPKGVKAAEFAFEDVVFRYAGKGSLGKNRYAILMRKDDAGDFGSLRLVEWKDSSDSPLSAAGGANKRRQSKNRNREVYEAALGFQLVPKRFLGYVGFFGSPMQCREIGANDCRFNHSQYKTAEGLEQAASVFGGITARAHLLSSLGQEGPRKFVERSGVTEDRLVQRLIAFATSYTTQVHEDFEEVRKGQGELVKDWKIQGLAGSGAGA